MNPDFLKQLDLNNLKEVYAEILALNLDGEVLESIEGYVTQGSINIDGSSSVRRTCSLTIVGSGLNIHEYYWGLHTKFKLNLGVKNNINNNYPEIIWFKQGEFVITNFTTSQSTSNYTINISGKDKMTLLNGELGGAIPSLTWDFGTVEVVDGYGNITKEKIPIKDIIIGAVHQFAQEPFHKIIINDLEDKGLELMEYRNDDPLYVIIDETIKEVYNMTLNGETTFLDKDGNSVKINNEELIIYNPLFDLDNIPDAQYTKVYDEMGHTLSIAKIEYGMTAGYRETDLVYAGELILNVGESVTSMLDKIVGMLGDFEYFYDLDGNFIFQRKPTYNTNAWNPIKEEYVENKAYSSPFTYSFEDGAQVISYSNNPDFENLRNDFSVWGERIGVSGATIPIHTRFAVDKKPTYFINKEKKIYTTLSLEGLLEILPEEIDLQLYAVYPNVDWREVIYQMAIDYNKHHLDEDYYFSLMSNNFGNYSNGKTGYEQYYVDLEGFWRSIYCPEYAQEDEYEVVYPSRSEYLNNYESYYYDAPNYMTLREEPYHSTYTYYHFPDDSKKLEKITITKEQYEEAQLNEIIFPYYWIDPLKPIVKASCKIVEPYQGSKFQYFNAKGEKLNSISFEDYSNNEINYYFEKEINYNPTALIKLYRSREIYYTYEDNKYKRVEYLDKKTYNKEPSLYYLRGYEYKRCSINDPYDSLISYYKEVYNSTLKEISYSRVSITEVEYKINPTLYFTKGEESTFIKCVNVVQKFNPNVNYALQTSSGFEEINIVNEKDFAEKAATGFLYYGARELECCVHPADYNTTRIFYKKRSEGRYLNSGWVRELYTAPETINFWFDFIDENSELQKYGSYAIGSRPKAINDSQVKSIYFRETPTIILVKAEDWQDTNKNELGYTYLQITKGMENLFTISAQGKTAKTAIDRMVYQMAQCAEKITITTLPIYYLIPNSKIFVRNDESGINGEYIISGYNLSLGNNGNMTINAFKALDKLY